MSVYGADRLSQPSRCAWCRRLHAADLWHDVIAGAGRVSTHTTCLRCWGTLRAAPTPRAQQGSVPSEALD
jgi:hypothetical protein